MDLGPCSTNPDQELLARLGAEEESASVAFTFTTAGGYRIARLRADGRGEILGWSRRRRRWAIDETFDHPLFWQGAPGGPRFVTRTPSTLQTFLRDHILSSISDPILPSRDHTLPIAFAAGSEEDLKRGLALIAAADPIARHQVPHGGTGGALTMAIWLYAPIRGATRLVGARWSAGSDRLILSPFGLLLTARLVADNPFDGGTAKLRRSACDRLSQAEILPSSVQVEPPLGDRSAHERMAATNAAATWVASLPDWSGTLAEAAAAIAGNLAPKRLAQLAGGLARRAVPMMGTQEIQITAELLRP